MQRIKFVLSTIILIAVTAVFYSCKDSVVEPTPVTGDLPVRTITNLQADTASTGAYTYFRLRDSTVVTGADTAAAAWDIAFNKTTIRVNGGPIHAGLGGAVFSAGVLFDTVTTALETYNVDTTATRLAITTGSGNGWYIYDFTNNVISPAAGIIYLRTGDGKYAKLEIKSYYSNSDPQPMPNPLNSRYYTFRYAYQPDGSRTIK